LSKATDTSTCARAACAACGFAASGWEASDFEVSVELAVFDAGSAELLGGVSALDVVDGAEAVGVGSSAPAGAANAPVKAEAVARVAT